MKKTTSTLMLILIASVLSSGTFAGENLQMMRCLHIIDGVPYDAGAVTGTSPQAVKSKCEIRVGANHASNPRDTSSPLPSNSILEFPHVPVGEANSNIVHCDGGVSGSIGNGPYN